MGAIIVRFRVMAPRLFAPRQHLWPPKLSFDPLRVAVCQYFSESAQHAQIESSSSSFSFSFLAFGNEEKEVKEAEDEDHNEEEDDLWLRLCRGFVTCRG